MVSNLIIIKNLAADTESFRTIRASGMQEVAEFPAMLITHQQDAEKRPVNAMATRYMTGWQYTVNVLAAIDHEEDDEYNQLALEQLCDKLKSKFVGTPDEPGKFQLISEERGEAMVSSRECLAAEITIKALDGREYYY